MHAVYLKRLIASKCSAEFILNNELNELILNNERRYTHTHTHPYETSIIKSHDYDLQILCGPGGT